MHLRKQVIMTYGIFEITGATISILSIVSIVLLILAVLMYKKLGSFLGVVPHLISIVLALIVLITLYTTMDWSGYGGLNFGGALCLTVIVGMCYLYPFDDVPDKKLSKK